MPLVRSHATLYRDERFHAAFPSIARLADDSLVLAFRRARDGHWLVPADRLALLDPMARVDHLDSRSHIALLQLDADGNPLPAPLDLLPMDPEAGDQDPSLLALPGGRLLLLSFSYYPLTAELEGVVEARSGSVDGRGCRYLPWGCHASLRGAEPRAWQFHHHYLPSNDEYGHWQGRELRHPMVGATRGQTVRFDGGVAAAVYWGRRDGCALFFSADDGRRWTFRARIAVDPDGHINFQEPALCPSAEGGLVAFMRTANAEGRLATAVSADGDEWEPPKLHELIGHPFHPLLLRDDRVLLSYGYRQPPYGIRARLLSSPTANPEDSEEIVIRDDGHCADLGYPWGVELADGNVLLVYYWTDEHGRRIIMGSRLAI